VADGGQDGVDGVALGAEQEVPIEVAIGVDVADRRFHGIAAPQFAPDGRRQAALLTTDEDAGAVRDRSPGSSSCAARSTVATA